MNRRIALQSLHPIVLFLYFACVLILSMCVTAPLYLAIDLVASVVLCSILLGRSSIKRTFGLMILLVVVAIVAPLFDPHGATVLFRYFGGRPYTLQALCGGAAMGTMLVAMLLWFSSFNAVMTSERITFLFGRMAPALSLVFTMVLRLVPSYERKLRRFAAARECIGRSASQGGPRRRIAAAGILLSMTLTWAFESGIRTADSMRCRGYGLADRTAYSVFRFDRKDAVALAMMVPLVVLSSIAMVSGAATMTYVPEFIGPSSDFAGVGAASFALLVFLPSLFELGDAWSWRFSLSRI